MNSMRGTMSRETPRIDRLGAMLPVGIAPRLDKGTFDRYGAKQIVLGNLRIQGENRTRYPAIAKICRAQAGNFKCKMRVGESIRVT